MTPMAFTRAFTGGERVHQPNHTSGAGHIALHVFHARGRLDGNTAGVETHAFTNEGNGRLACLSAIPPHNHDATFPRRTLADAKQRVHAEFLHRLEIEDFDCDAEFLQRTGAARELLRIKDVGGFVHKIARKEHSIRNR